MRAASPSRSTNPLLIAPKTSPGPGFFPPTQSLRHPGKGTIRATERREARMYIGLGTVLLIVLIIILLIWVF
jgi:hypothetical protein